MKAYSLTVFLLISVSSFAQVDYQFPSLSPKGSLSQMIGTTSVKITYERPSARKRKIFGNLVPYNQVWRTGAGNCTTISFDQEVKIEGQEIAAGTYSIFSIPNRDHWIFILNSDTTLYGSGFYDSNKDVIRFIVPVSTSDRYYETLNFDIDLIPNNAMVYLSWENTQVQFLIETMTDDKMDQFIKDELLTGKNKDSDTYANAAEHLYFGRRNMLTAVALTEKALEINPNNGWASNVKIQLLLDMKKYEEALDYAKSLYQRDATRNFASEEEKKMELDFWQSLINKIETQKEQK